MRPAVADACQEGLGSESLVDADLSEVEHQKPLQAAVDSLGDNVFWRGERASRGRADGTGVGRPGGSAAWDAMVQIEAKHEATRADDGEALAKDLRRRKGLETGDEGGKRQRGEALSLVGMGEARVHPKV